ncbi:MAG: transglutaminase domain-containing protein [Lachnospiraceae bacterium]|nr:transglutaminase domain-containing protein [Lachnospiraceae bacterium]
MGQGASGEKAKKKRALHSAQRGVCMSLMLFGAFLCLEENLASGVNPANLAMVAVLCAVGEELAKRGWRQRMILLLLASFLLEWAISMHAALLAEGAKGLANQAVALVNQHYRTEFLSWLVPEPASGKAEAFSVLCAILGSLEGIIASFANKKRVRNAAFLCIPLLVFAAGVFVGKAPHTEGVLLALAGFFALQLEPGMRGALPLGAGMGAALVLAALFAADARVQQVVEACHGPWLKRQLQFEDRLLDLVGQFSGIRLFSWQQPQQDYVLDNKSPNQTGEEVFQITVDKRPRHPIYVRGFIGGDYRDGKWDGISRQEFSDWAQGQGWPNQECQEAVLGYPYKQLEKREGLAAQCVSSHMEMLFQSAVPGYTLVPYYTKIPKGQPAKGDGSLAPVNDKKFQWESFLCQEAWQEEGFPFLENKGEQAFSEGDGEDKAQEEKIWESYGDYAQQTYTRLPEHGLEKAFVFAEVSIYRASIRPENLWMEGLSDQEGDSQIWLRFWQIREFLWQNTKYSQQLKPLPQGEDFTAYFLLKQKKGFCVHYATAGTLLLRRFGIPARYVSGYVVFPEDFKQNGDGSFTASVTGLRGHAWAEVFQKEAGFRPMEFTPPSYFTALQESQKKEELDGALQELKGTKEKEEGDGAEKKLPEEEERQKQEEEQGQRQKEEQKQNQPGGIAPGNSVNAGEGRAATQRAVGKAAAFGLAALCFAFLLLCVRERRARGRRKAEFFQDDRAKGALAMGNYICFLLNSLGLKPKEGMGEQEYGAALGQKLPGMEWEKAVSLMQKAAFSRQGITEEELQVVAGLCQKLEQTALAEKGRLWGWLYGARVFAAGRHGCRGGNEKSP